MRWIYEDERDARHILWEAFRQADVQEGWETLINAIQYLERTRPEEFTRFVPMGAN